MVDVVAPKWGLTTEEYVLLSWRCEVGEQVAAGQPLGELEADKVEGEFFSPADGTVEELVASAGDRVEPGQVIARLATGAG